MRRLCIPIAIAISALVLAACGSEEVSVSADNPDLQEGAQIFAQHCAGCHTLTPAGTQGSGNRALRVQGPNLDQRAIGLDDALYAIHNGGASGAIMPQNIVVGIDADKVAAFIAEYSGTQVVDSPRPSANTGSGSSSTGQGASSSGQS